MRTLRTIDMAEAKMIAEAAIAEATKQGWPVTVAVTDVSGITRVLLSMDGAKLVSVQTAQGKALTATMTLRPTAEDEAMLKTKPGHQRFPGYTPKTGGLPIMVGKECIGGIGVSGVKGEQDEQIARAGLSTFKP